MINENTTQLRHRRRKLIEFSQAIHKSLKSNPEISDDVEKTSNHSGSHRI